MKTLRLLIVLAFAISGLQTGADQPLPPPKRPEVKSPSGQYLATIDPKKGVSVHSVKPGKTLWKAPHIWSRSVRLADDGELTAPRPVRDGGSAPKKQFPFSFSSVSVPRRIVSLLLRHLVSAEP